MNVHKTKYDWGLVAEQIAGDKTSKYDQAYAIYRWLCDNVSYDTTYSIYDADTAFEQKCGVCQAYYEMFYRIAEPLGLKVLSIRRRGLGACQRRYMAAQLGAGPRYFGMDDDF